MIRGMSRPWQMIPAVWRARSRGEQNTRSKATFWSRAAVSLAWVLPVSFKGRSVLPQTMFSTFQAVWPWRVT